MIPENGSRQNVVMRRSRLQKVAFGKVSNWNFKKEDGPQTRLELPAEGTTALSRNNELLNGWKEIAAYFDRGIRTVQRWETDLQLPVRRPRGKARSAIVALRAELHEWMARAPSQFHEHDGSRQENAAAQGLKVLVVEDSIKDLNTCVGVLRAMGVTQLDAISNVPGTLLHLKEMANRKLPKPDMIILDPAFSLEGGFEVLRYWKSKPALKSISMVVWTGVGYTEQELCATFGVNRVVRKWAGAAELAQAVKAAVTALHVDVDKPGAGDSLKCQRDQQISINCLQQIQGETNLGTREA